MVYISFGIFAVFWIMGAILTESSNSKRKFTGWICTIIGVVMVIATLVLAAKTHNERVKANQSEDTSSFTALEQLPENFKSGTIVDTTEQEWYVVKMDKEEESKDLSE